MMRWLTFTILALAMVLVRSASATHPLRTGFVDPVVFSGSNAQRSFVRARTAGARLFRLNVFWNSVAPESPANPGNPDDPAYHWGSVDLQVVEAVRADLDPILFISGAPDWARGKAVGLPGTWPSP